jgi:glyoxylase-like metal-dependent hydrolase (beta-lactamase superfamily II)
LTNQAHNKYEVTLRDNQGWDPRILVFGCGKVVDNFLVVTERYVVMVDTMINARTASVMLDVAQEALNGSRQLLVINSHADWDHCWGNQLFSGNSAVYPAPIIATRRCYERFQGPEKYTFIPEMQAKEPDVFGDLDLTPPTILFDDQLLIDGGDLSLRLFLTPGHQPDHVSILIPEISTLLAGDAAELPCPMAASAATLPQLRASLAHMASMNPAVTLYCHAPVTIGSQLLQYNIQYFDRLELQCREALEARVPVNPPEGTDFATLLQFPVEEAFVAATEGDPYPAFYTQYHNMQARLMLEYLASTMPTR